MKRLLIFVLLISNLGLTQTIDTTCVYARWIQLYPTKLNSDIFGLDSSISTKVDLINVIKKLVEVDSLNIYSEKQTNNGGTEWIYIDYSEELIKAQNNPKNKNKNNWNPYFTRLGPENDIPLTDEFGDPRIVLNEEGYESFVYEEREVFELRTSKIDEIIIKEIRILNSLTGQYEFQPSDLGFFIKTDEHKRNKELFWININELQKVLKNDFQYSWLSAINEKRYSGFLSKQVNCDNAEVNYLETIHPIILPISDSCSCKLTTQMIRQRKDYVVKIPYRCNNGVKVYFGVGGTQTDISLYTLHDGSETLAGYLTFANEGDREYMVFNTQETYLIKYRPCHTRIDFKIIIE